MQEIDIIEALEAELKAYQGKKELTVIDSKTGEKLQNRGEWIDEINKWMGVPLGSAYCLSGLLFCIRKVETKLQVKFDLPKRAGTLEFYDLVNSKYKVVFPSRFCIGIFKSKKHAGQGHAVYCQNYSDPRGTFPTMEFNSNPKGDREGDGFILLDRNIKGDASLLPVGYIDLSRCLLKSSPDDFIYKVG